MAVNFPGTELDGCELAAREQSWVAVNKLPENRVGILRPLRHIFQLFRSLHPSPLPCTDRWLSRTDRSLHTLSKCSSASYHRAEIRRSGVILMFFSLSLIPVSACSLTAAIKLFHKCGKEKKGNMGT
uniref:Uncharacterized protein n=1 Tax=Setaria digitata TaxID=48799 RepID=A0A915PP34_9BILA